MRWSFDFFQLFGDNTRNQFLYLAIALIPLNLAMEALKWKYLAQKISDISFNEAFKGVLGGITLGMVTPHAIGDYAARIYFINSHNAEETIGSIFLSRISQLFITVSYGILGFFILLKFDLIHFTEFFNLYSFIFIGVAFVVLFFGLIYFKELTEKFSQYSVFSRIWNYVKVLTKYSFNDFGLCLILSLFRYFTFTAQFLLVLFFVGLDEASILTLAGIWLVFFSKSFFPSFSFLNDLGIREASAIHFFSILHIDNQISITASLIVWILNNGLPALIGALFLLINKEKSYYK